VGAQRIYREVAMLGPLWRTVKRAAWDRLAAMGRTFAIANGVLAALFLVSALLQFNDPDSLRWFAMYVAAAAACVVAWRVRGGWWAPAAIGLVAVAWAVALSPILPDLRFDDLAREMKAANPRIELSRELLGLLIIATWMIVLVVVSRRAHARR